MSAFSQFPQKFLEYKPNFILQCIKGLDHRCRLSLAEVGEQYNRGRLKLILKLSCELEGHRCGWIGCIEIADSVDDRPRIEAREGEGQFPMFSLSVQIMNNPEFVVQRVASVIRLYTFDDVLGSVAREDLYFSLETGRTIFVETLAKDGKLDFSGLLLPTFRTSEEPSNVIEARSEVMENFTSKNGEPKRYSQLSQVFRFLVERINIFITHDWALAFLEEPCDFNLKIDDVLVGPL